MEKPEGFEERLTEEIARELQAELDHPLDEAAWARIKQEVKERLRAELAQRQAQERQREKREEEYLVRFSLNVRAQHLVLALGVIILIVTGLPIKFHESAWAKYFFQVLSLELSRLLHRVGASLLMGVGIWHMLYLLTPEGRREFVELLPRPKDFFDFLQNIKYLLGLTHEKPKFGRFSYIEKFDYWAVYWGMVIMIGSGLLLWFHNWALGLFPKYVLDIAREAHSDEALLATLAIVIWHWYNAHFNPSVFPMNTTIFTGKISKGRMMEEHPLEYERWLQEKEKTEAEGS